MEWTSNNTASPWMVDDGQRELEQRVELPDPGSEEKYSRKTRGRLLIGLAGGAWALTLLGIWALS